MLFFSRDVRKVFQGATNFRRFNQFLLLLLELPLFLVHLRVAVAELVHVFHPLFEVELYINLRS
jgi:hypothetical protein